MGGRLREGGREAWGGWGVPSYWGPLGQENREEIQVSQVGQGPGICIFKAHPCDYAQPGSSPV